LVRGVERGRLHADLTVLATLSCALARAREPSRPTAGTLGSLRQILDVRLGPSEDENRPYLLLR